MDRQEIKRMNTLFYVENELRICARLNHPNIVKVYDIIYEEKYIMIIMEFLPNSDLQTLLERGIHFTVERQILLAYQILQGLNYLHQRGIAHRDIKPQNILFDECMNPKIIDFGLSKENNLKMHTLCGTPLYMAPEIIEGRPYDGRKADIWTFGVTLHVLSCYSYPWQESSDTALIKAIKSHNLELDIDAKGTIGEVIRKILVFDPNKRPTAEELINFLEGKNSIRPISQSVNLDRKPVNDHLLPKLLFPKKAQILLRERVITRNPMCRTKLF